MQPQILKAAQHHQWLHRGSSRSPIQLKDPSMLGMGTGGSVIRQSRSWHHWHPHQRGTMTIAMAPCHSRSQTILGRRAIGGTTQLFLPHQSCQVALTTSNPTSQKQLLKQGRITLQAVTMQSTEWGPHIQLSKLKRQGAMLHSCWGKSQLRRSAWPFCSPGRCTAEIWMARH